METTFTTVKRDIIIRTTPERVWKALTVPEERNRWETRSCSIDLKVGGTIELDYGWGVSYRGTITELIEPSRMVISDDENELTIWTLEPHAEGTLVSIEYTSLWSGDLGIMSMENMAYGTYRFMRNMKNVLECGQDIRSTFWKSWIGVNHRSHEGNEANGVTVVQVIEGTPSEGVLQVGDIIIQVDGCDVLSYDDLEEKITCMEPSGSLQIKYLRNGLVEIAEMMTVPFGWIDRSITTSS